MKPYPKYKDSGVEWIGDVPEGWGVAPVRSFAKSGYKTFTDGDWIESPYIREQGIRLIQTGNIGIGTYREQGFRYIDEESFLRFHCTEVEAGDILICRLADPVGRACLAPNLGVRMITSVDVCILKPHCENDARFVVYGLSSPHYLSWMNAICRGGTRNRVSRSMLGSICLQKPPLKEQTAIAAYLDRKTTQIDNLISKKQKLIELLKEERAAIINQAVTKGLNPDAPMKDSGIEWLGEVPEHWEVKRLKYIASINEENLSEKTDANIEIKYIDIGNVCLGSIVNEPVTMYFKDAPSRARRIVRKGDTIISTVRTYLKAITYISDVPQNLIVSTGFAVIRPGDDFDKKFISFLLTSEMIVDTICSLSVGVSYPAINASDIANLIIWFPPDKTEQAAIVQHVNKTTTKIDQTTSKIEKQIGLLKEYRTALISEVVTGKIDVRT